jgi:ABC-type Na+ efflux pump permease subunit
LADPRLTIARRELAVLRSEKTIVLALLIQLFIAAFSSFLVVGLVSLYDPGSAEEFQVEIAVTGDARAELLAAVDDEPGLIAREYGDRESARQAFESERVHAILDAERKGGRVSVDAVAPDENVRTTVVVVKVREALRAFERSERADRAAFLDSQPLALPPAAGSSPYYGFTYTMLVPLLLFLPVFIGGSIAVDSLTEEFERGTLELLRVAPVSMADVVDGKVLAAAGLAPVQAALWLALLAVNGTTVGHPLVLLVLVAALATVVASLGASVGLLAPERRTAQFLYSIGVLLVFGGTTLLPASPANVAARLAIDSAGTSAYLAVATYGLLAVGAYACVRHLVGRVDVSER